MKDAWSMTLVSDNICTNQIFYHPEKKAKIFSKNVATLTTKA
jgi:hypothetical protein